MFFKNELLRTKCPSNRFYIRCSSYPYVQSVTRLKQDHNYSDDQMYGLFLSAPQCFGFFSVRNFGERRCGQAYGLFLSVPQCFGFFLSSQFWGEELPVRRTDCFSLVDSVFQK